MSDIDLGVSYQLPKPHNFMIKEWAVVCKNIAKMTIFSRFSRQGIPQILFTRKKNC